MIRLIFVGWLLSMCIGAAFALDMRSYMPQGETWLYRADSVPVAHYTLTKSKNSPFKPKGGYMVDLRKDYYAGSQWAELASHFTVTNGWFTPTTAQLYYGDNGSVIELGDVFPDGRVLGYTSGGKMTGLAWSPVKQKEMAVTSNGQAVAQAYIKTEVIEKLAKYRPDYGNCGGYVGYGCGKMYKDVIHVVMYHGVNGENNTSCQFDAARKGIRYERKSNYKSYAMEFYLAKGVGIVEEITPYVEDGAYFGKSDCFGEVMGGWNNYHSYRMN